MARPQVSDQALTDVAVLVALNQLGVVEIVAGVHFYLRRQTPAHGDLTILVEQRDLDPIDLIGVIGNNLKACLGRGVQVARAPVARQRRVKHIAQPMNNHWLRHLRQNPIIHPRVVVRPTCHGRQRAAGHQDHAPTGILDKADLLGVGFFDIGQGQAGAQL